MITFHCGGCSYKYTVDEAYAGRKARCKRCNRINVIPVPEIVTDAPEEIEEPLRLVPDPDLDKLSKTENEPAGQNENIFSKPGRTLPLSVAAVLFLTPKKLYIAIALLIAGFLIAARIPELTDNQKMFFLVPGFLATAYHAYRFIRNSCLLKNGIHTVGQVARITENKFRFDGHYNYAYRYNFRLFDLYYFKTYSIEYRFYDEDGNVCYGEIVTTSPDKITDEQYEVMFFSKRNPRTILLLDSLPGQMYLDEQGSVRIGSYLSVAVTLAGVATVFAVLYYVINTLLKEVN